LTLPFGHSTLSTIFRKGAPLMNRFGYVSAMPVTPNPAEQVRTVVVSDARGIREGVVGIVTAVNQPLISDR